MKKLLIFLFALCGACGCSETDREAPGDAGGTELRFRMQGVSVELPAVAAPAAAEASRADASPAAEKLAAGTTVRIVACARRTDGAAPDFAQDTYVSEATYVVQADGSLKACTVDAAGTSTGTDGASAMRLRAGTYDLYALTPALPLADRRTVSVAHGTDYAGSVTPACAVAVQAAGAPQTVTLAMLERRCSRLVFSITRKAANVQKAVINSVQLARIAASPASAIVGAALPTGAHTGSYTFPDGTFTPGAVPYEASGADEVLPKSSAVYDLAMKVTFNDAEQPAELAAELPALAFRPAVRYNFDVALKGDAIVLSLQVTPWNTDAVWDMPDIGEPPFASVIVGKWAVDGWNTDVGGYFVPVLRPDSWVANSNWQTDLGAYFNAVFRPEDWNGNSAWDAEFGGAAA